jgi:hypothetical protein
MTPLTQYGRMAEKHWREHRPKMVRELEAKGLLHQMLLEAEEKTKDEMATLRTEFDAAGINGATGPRRRRGKWCGRNTSCSRPKRLSRPPQRPPQPKNRREISTTYRITEADRLGDGGPKQKFQQNLAAIETLRTLDAEERPGTERGKGRARQIRRLGRDAPGLRRGQRDWRKEQRPAF